MPHTNELIMGTSLKSDTKIFSPNEKFHLMMQTDGNLVLYEGRHCCNAIWSSQTCGKGPDCRFDVQRDGNLVVYQGKQSVWSSGTYDKIAKRDDGPVPMLSLQNDGNLVLYEWESVWSSNTMRAREHFNAREVGAPSTMELGCALGPDQEMMSPNGFYRLKMQGDGNLVLYDGSNSSIWASGTYGQQNCHFRMQSDGNMVVYANHIYPVWSSNTCGAFEGMNRTTPRARLVIQNDGNLVLYKAKSVWASNTMR
eukprot:99214_1